MRQGNSHKRSWSLCGHFCEGGSVPLLSAISWTVVKASLSFLPRKAIGLAVTQTSVQIQALPIEVCVTVGKLPHLSEPQFTYQ